MYTLLYRLLNSVLSVVAGEEVEVRLGSSASSVVGFGRC